MVAMDRFAQIKEFNADLVGLRQQIAGVIRHYCGIATLLAGVVVTLGWIAFLGWLAIQVCVLL
jgi:hypothetical protein